MDYLGFESDSFLELVVINIVVVFTDDLEQNDQIDEREHDQGGQQIEQKQRENHYNMVVQLVNYIVDCFKSYEFTGNPKNQYQRRKEAVQNCNASSFSRLFILNILEVKDPIELYF